MLYFSLWILKNEGNISVFIANDIGRSTEKNIERPIINGFIVKINHAQYVASR